MATGIRRVVTGHNKAGKAVVVTDGAAPNVKVRPGTGLISTLLWVTDTAPAKLADEEDFAAREIGITPPLNGTILRMLEIPGGANRTPEQLAAIQAARANEAAHAPANLQLDLTSRHPGMHRTESVDYALVMSGEIVMLLDDDSETHLKAGDVVIMQGTYHAWANRSDKPCTIAFILVGAEVPWKK